MSSAALVACGLSLLGGRLCLDFANTVDWRTTDHQVDWLTGYDRLLSWSRHAGALAEAEVLSLAAKADVRLKEAGVVLARAIALREAIFRIISSAIKGEPAIAGDLATLNEELARAQSAARIKQDAAGFNWAWRDDALCLDRMLWPVSRSATDLLTSDDLSRTRECPADDCHWLFLDTSRNQSRRWCSMESCGNRAKAKRHYRRTAKR